MKTRPRPTPEFLREFPWLAPDPTEREAEHAHPKALIHAARRWPRKRKAPSQPSPKGG